MYRQNNIEYTDQESYIINNWEFFETYLYKHSLLFRFHDDDGGELVEIVKKFSQISPEGWKKIWDHTGFIPNRLYSLEQWCNIVRLAEKLHSKSVINELNQWNMAIKWFPTKNENRVVQKQKQTNKERCYNIQTVGSQRNVLNQHQRMQAKRRIDKKGGYEHIMSSNTIISGRATTSGQATRNSSTFNPSTTDWAEQIQKAIQQQLKQPLELLAQQQRSLAINWEQHVNAQRDNTLQMEAHQLMDHGIVDLTIPMINENEHGEANAMNNQPNASQPLDNRIEQMEKEPNPAPFLNQFNQQ
jgi:hypothetical protein